MVFISTSCYPSSLAKATEAPDAPGKRPDDPSCTFPEAKYKGALRDICVLHPSGVCEGDEIGCLYADVTKGCVYIMCRTTCESDWVEKHFECVQAPAPVKSYEEQYEEHGL